LANAPAIILLDEPTGDLDSKSTIEVMNLLLEINNFGYTHGEQAEGQRADPITIVMVTHN
jgi:putative ABC transport system ATP-binding protein